MAYGATREKFGLSPRAECDPAPRLSGRRLRHQLSYRGAQKLGIGYEALAALNDLLIYASFSGYGEKGAEATKPGFDVTAWWARSSPMDTVRPANGMGDHSAGFTLFSGIMIGLYQPHPFAAS